MEELTTRTIDTLISVRTKVITLCLQQVRWQASRSVTIKEGQC
ncbi:Uncharacterised protein [Vibrio cholerae]|nr:Uncharacterised protein [Vibrio cholerae]CSA36995.1 Uncharacterised protein [Vibrio cholerae]CSB52620.1 Uncharacterised protein [Vibrio cholerae]CSB71475.1 Uncharacterised protein [Vibrio cholerae]